MALAPAAHQASDGRVVINAPAGADRLEVRVGGVPARVLGLRARARGAGTRLTAEIAVTNRAGADVELVARAGKRELARTTVPDVHLLGPAAFAVAAQSKPYAPAVKAAQAIVSGSGGTVGVSAECLGSGRTASANADTRVVAASVLKVAILLTAFSRDRGDPTRGDVYPTYREAIVHSNNDSANRVIAMAGGGSESLGAQRINAFMKSLGMTQSYLDGPYRLSGGPSLKRTSAGDLERLGRALYQAANGQGPLPAMGVTPGEARVLIGLMASEDYPGLIREHLPGPVAHKAGWLDTVQTDLALAFGMPGGPCIVGVVTNGLSFGSADAIGKQVAERVIPLLAVAPKRTRVAAPAAATPTPTTHRVAPPPPPASSPDDGGGGRSWVTLGLALAVIVLAALAASRVVVLRRRRSQRERARAERRAAGRLS